MDLTYLDDEGYKDIPLLKMEYNKHGGLPFFVRKYRTKTLNISLHRHEYTQINYVCHGKGKHFIKGNEFCIYKGDIFVIPPYVPHCIITSDDSDMEIFEFEFEAGFVNQSFDSTENIESFFDFAYLEPFLVCENYVKPCLNLTGKVQLDVESILSEVLIEYVEKPAGYKLLIKAELLKLLVLVGREFTKNVKKSATGSVYCLHRDVIFNAVKYINEHYAEELYIEDIANKFLLSQSYFSYLFKILTLKSFTEYLNDLRIIKAMELLEESNKRVLDICFDVGFNNVNHFNRQFKRYTGRSPLSYRKSLGTS
ncbi:MAG: helix-turn-helix domain-containing protein [Ruminiclostridium sp.]|nr:helix-turn-helix domain-containing protein [Ruminiclostridium sp.]